MAARLTNHQIQEIVSFRNLVQVTYPGAELIMFGSAAWGKSHAFSDVDIAVVSNEFEGVPWSSRIHILKQFCGAGSPVSPVGVTEEEIIRTERCYPSVLRVINAGPNLKSVLGETDD